MGWVYGHVASGQSLSQTGREARGVSNKGWSDTEFGPLAGEVQLRRGT